MWDYRHPSEMCPTDVVQRAMRRCFTASLGHLVQVELSLSSKFDIWHPIMRRVGGINRRKANAKERRQPFDQRRLCGRDHLG
jgi:hypothetical protein